MKPFNRPKSVEFILCNFYLLGSGHDSQGDSNGDDVSSEEELQEPVADSFNFGINIDTELLLYACNK